MTFTAGLPGESESECTSPAQTIHFTQEIPDGSGIKAHKNRKVSEIILYPDLPTQANINCVGTYVVIK